MITELSEVKNKLQNDGKIFCFFLSPSGTGYKVVYRYAEEITESKALQKTINTMQNSSKKNMVLKLIRQVMLQEHVFSVMILILYLNENAEPLEVKEFVETVKKLDLSSIRTDDEKDLSQKQ